MTSGDFTGTVNTDIKASKWQKILRFLGPAYLISVGYMDPGNWATDIAAGSKFGYTLLWVVVLSNIAAILLQSHSARFGLVTGKDLAQFSRSFYPKWLSFVYWIFAEVAIAATDLAEILGMAIGLKLLFGLNMLIGVTLTLFDTLLIMFLVKRGMRTLESIIIALISVIGISFCIELFYSKPSAPAVIQGLVPGFSGKGALYVAIGIIGATVMPHNLYLHSSLVQTRKFARDSKGIAKAIKYNFIDTSIALNIALLVNAAILILAASAFFSTGHTEVEDISDAYKMLSPVLGKSLAPVLFAIALIASSQSSTLTGTLTGQIIMEGYLNIRLAPWLRRLITRLVALVPAFLTILFLGEKMVGSLLVLSQVVLSLQLGFVIIPLLYWVSSKSIMKEFRISLWNRIFSWFVVGMIIYLNIRMVGEYVMGWARISVNPQLYYFLIIPAVSLGILLLLYTLIEPVISRIALKEITTPHAVPHELVIHSPKSFERIAIALDFSENDVKAINYAISLGGKNAEYLLLHVVESAGARIMRSEVLDNETGRDRAGLVTYAGRMQAEYLNASVHIDYGYPEDVLPEMVKKLNADLIIMSSHRRGFLHRFLKGTTINKVQAHVNIPVFVVK